MFAQQNYMDSLKTVLKNAKHDSTRCFILSLLVENEYDEKIWPVYNDSLYELAKKNEASSPQGNLKKKYSSYYANSINNRGYLAQEHGDILKALEYYSIALKIQEKNGDKVQSATTINNIAYIYMHQGDLNKALEWVEKALKLQREAGNIRGEALSLNNLGNIYLRKNNNQQALDYFEQSLKLQIEQQDKYGEAMCLANIGDVYIKQGDNVKGAEYTLKALDLRKELGELEGLSYSLDRMADMMLMSGNLNEALKYANESYKVAQQLNYAENLRNATRTLYKIYKKQNKNKEALEMYEFYVRMHDSINNEVTRKASIKNQFQYEYEKKAAADSVRVSEEKKIVQVQLKQERTQRFALYGGLALVALFGIFMFNRFKVTQKQNILIKEQKTELQKQKELVEEHQKETLDSIHYAKRIQSALIANSDFITEYLPDNFIFFNPKDIVSGDFYWASHHHDKFYLAACDSTGHGVPGAFMSLLNMGFLSEAIKEKGIEKPHEVFNYVRERLMSTISDSGQKDGMDGILVCVDPKNKIIEYAAANNEPILIRDNQLIELAKDKMPVGKGERMESFTLHTLELKQGDVLYLYTDGYADQFGGVKGKKFKYKQLNDLLLSISQKPLTEQKHQLENTFINWKGNLEQVDDVLIIGLKLS